MAIGVQMAFTLGVENSDGSAPGSDRFPAADPAAVRGIVQFLSDMGAATVAAAPSPPPVTGGN